MNLRRVLAVYERQLFEMLHTPAEIFELLYWPFFDLLAWGLLTDFLERGTVDLPLPITFLIGAALLWNVLYRTQLGIAVTFLNEVWSNNVITMLASPLTRGEYLLASLLWAGTQLVAVVGIMSLLAWLAFTFGIFELGLGLVPFVAALLMFGVAMALVVLGLVLRIGHGANVLAWGLAGIVQPLSAVYYPLEVLPGWAQAVAHGVPASHIFEGMRHVLATGAVPWDRVGVAFALNAIYLAAGAAFARAMFASMQRRGLVTRYAS